MSATRRPTWWFALTGKDALLLPVVWLIVCGVPMLELDWFAPPPAGLPRPIVVTGVFDVLHVGHVRFLRFARAAGAALAVGVESDARAAARKGDGRPLVR